MTANGKGATVPASLGIARQVVLEIRKGKRKHLWLICAAMLGVLLLRNQRLYPLIGIPVLVFY